MGYECEVAANQGIQRGTLWTLVSINTAMFVLELGAGILAHSSALLADSVDMLVDAVVFALALIVSRESLRIKRRAAFGTGILEAILGFCVLAEVVHKWIAGSHPEFQGMILVGTVAGAANIGCLFLLRRHRRGEAHIRATWIFTRTDVLANLGTVVAGFLIFFTRSTYPDLIMGSLICLIILHGSIEILRGEPESQAL